MNWIVNDGLVNALPMLLQFISVVHLRLTLAAGRCPISCSQEGSGQDCLVATGPVQ